MRKIIISALILLVVPPSLPVFAHIEPWYWEDETQTVRCMHTLDSKLETTSNVNICDDIITSSNKWNNVPGSTWNVDVSTSTGWAINGVDDYFETRVLGETTVAFYPSTGRAATVYILINGDVNWGDVVDGDNGVYDYQSVIGHELGHLAGIAHNGASSSVMKSPLAEDISRRSPNYHDRSSLSSVY